MDPCYVLFRHILTSWPFSAPSGADFFFYGYILKGACLSRVEYAYTTGELGEPLNTLAYGYDDTFGWKDLLTSYAGQARSYDTIGNLTSDGTWTYTWQGGRQLASMAKDGTSVSFAYDEKGLRLSKTVNDAVTRYTYSQGELIHVLDGSDRMTIRRDPNGQPMTIGFNGSEHFYLYNAQGDVVAIANYSGEVVVEYTYDAWGNPLSCTGSLADTLGKKNPFRYRGYVYDEETGLYYLKSRYYDPRVGRFICSDGILPSNRMTSSNLFAYCNNNPIGLVDPSGKIGIIGGLIIGLITIGAAGFLSACSTSNTVSSNGISNLRIGNHDYSKSNCVGYGYLYDGSINIGQLGNKPLDRSYLDSSGKYTKSQAKSAILSSIKADASSPKTWFNTVSASATKANDPLKEGYVRLAIFRGGAGQDIHVLRRTSAGTWWHKEGNFPLISFVDDNLELIVDPQTAFFDEFKHANEFIGYYDIGIE